MVHLAVSLGVGGVALASFIWRQLTLQKRDAALLDLRTFRYSVFTIALSMMAIGMMALFGSIIMLPLVLQQAYGLDPLQVGLMMLPGGIAMGLLSPVVGRLYDRVGPRVLVVPASLVVMGVFLALSTLSPTTPWWFIMACHATMTVSFAFIFTPLFTVSLGALPHRLYSHGSAMVGTVQQIAGAAGTTLFVGAYAVMSSRAEAGGADAASAMLTGTHWAFLGAGALWTCAVVLSFFLRRPDGEIA